MDEGLSRSLAGSYETEADLKALMEKAKKEERKYCDGCMRCFNEEHGTFDLKPILACKRVSKTFKDFYQLKEAGVYLAEQPFMTNLEAIPQQV